MADDTTHLRLVVETTVAGKKTRRRIKGKGTCYLRGNTYTISFPVPGGPRVTKSTGLKDKEAAEHLLTEEIAAVGRGETTELQPWLFGETATAWLKEDIEDSGEYRGRTINYWGGIVRNHLIPVFETTSLHYLQEHSSILQNYVRAKQTGVSSKSGEPLPVEGRAQTKLANETVVDHITVLGMIFKFARKKNLMTSSKDPMRDVKRPKRNFRETVKALEPEQIVAIQEQLTKPEDQFFSFLILHLGLRIGEAVGLYVSDYKAKTKQLTIQRTVECDEKGHYFINPYDEATKTEEGERTLKLGDILAARLEAHIAEMRKLKRIPSNGDGFIFPNERGTLKSPNNWRGRVWNKAVEDGGVWNDALPAKNKPTPHWLRHTYASRLIAAGVPPTTIAHNMGHTGPDITLRIYAHIFKAQAAEIADTVHLYEDEDQAA